jgi:hypothetical protein
MDEPSSFVSNSADLVLEAAEVTVEVELTYFISKCLIISSSCPLYFSSSIGTSLISSQLQSLWQGMAGGGDAAAAAAAAADDVGFVRDESAFAALAAAAVPQAMR